MEQETYNLFDTLQKLGFNIVMPYSDVRIMEHGAAGFTIQNLSNKRMYIGSSAQQNADIYSKGLIIYPGATMHLSGRKSNFKYVVSK